MAGLEAEIGKLLASARAVQQQYGIRPADSRGGGDVAVDQQQAEQQQQETAAAAAAAAAAGEQPAAGGDVAMQEAGEA